MERILVIGTSGCGKTTFARRLASALDAPHVEMDAVHWLPDWVERPDPEFRELMAVEAARDRWVIDGNYRAVRDVVWPRVTAVIWLDYPFATTFSRALARTLRRVFHGEVAFSGNRESFRRAFLSHDSILLWVVTTYHRRRREYRGLFTAKTFPNVALTVLPSPGAAERYFAELGSAVPRAAQREPTSEATHSAGLPSQESH